MKIKDTFRSMSAKKIKEQIEIIEKGCGKKVDYNGDCFYYSSQGKLRLCSKCSRQLKIAKEILKERKRRRR